MSPIMCFMPQRKAVLTLLAAAIPIKDSDVVGVQSPIQLVGTEDVTFAVVVGHPEQVPTDVYQMLLERGYVLWNLDDSYRRVRYNVEHADQQRPA